MPKINDGGPAFPVPNEGQGWGAPGMSLRDWFAGQALNGEIAAQGEEALSIPTGMTVSEALARDAKRRAEWCYRQADAMLAARAEGGAE